ncbi:5-methyltetrahydropteroyltriglutamate--homocysteine S-methyltransferase [Brevibacterium mcbrellneri ATCC 49030]|uniref:5-methyltetrahydropteroyltriglutamate--homocysteine S-methyltransferase n=1 Tax=Brevibacterium mcbrellneri ATCC 49030 TaxID=585530 RepID=D4YLL7_9MICO|nr:5-methyltetrahydropteroyltriglutamate--homocysteine S-methyltransferase [Brevibacterium mcbrellneri]EFG47934.1 5-methyltetrahydropteroyltriglutamate--homocysteine S-methyltransferase [Brevibacterium mcbrellneri ATCC 49030]
MTTSSQTPFPHATVTGLPRIGPRRELKRALEALWAGTIDESEYAEAAHSLRLSSYDRQRDLGLVADYAIPGDFSAYDQVLDAALAAGLVGEDTTGTDLGEYFALARGTVDRAPLEMTKWFDTNYHYLVPEVVDDRPFTARPQRILELVDEARQAGHTIRPVLLGPVTLLALSKPAEGAGRQPLDRLDELVDTYAELLTALHAAGVEWVQLDEPTLVTDLDAVSDEELAQRAGQAHARLLATADRPQVLITAPYGSLRAGLDALLGAGPEALGVDLSAATRTIDPEWLGRLKAADFGGTRLVAGVIDGRNIWAADLEAELAVLTSLQSGGREVSVSTSTSLLHVPYTVSAEKRLPVDVAGWLSFAEEKVTEVEALAAALDAHGEGAADPVSVREAAFSRSARAVRTRAESDRVVDEQVRARVAAIGERRTRVGSVEERREAQESLGLPLLPTTTIGSFPQTPEVRQARAALRGGRISEDEYTETMRAEIAQVVKLQEELGFDVIVHGEPERNDMVQYFAENLAGFAVTDHGWVQSYGSRCTRPPILFGDVHRPEPITVPWSTYAASLTDKPVKGMLTGPVTILSWSFVRDDVPLSTVAEQIGLALSDEVAELESAGVRIIQIDEPALRELLPLRADNRADYIAWAVDAFRLSSISVDPGTQIHTHLCYSEFGQVIAAIDALDADVTSIEAARSRMELLASLDPEEFDRSVGPGVYDIHSPRVPTVEELTGLLEAAITHVPRESLWVNPDCGLKTRKYEEVRPALANLVEARNEVRAKLTV